MSMRNLLKAGELVVPVPIGVLMTLQYNVDGNLEKVYAGIQDDRTDITKSKLVQMIGNKTVPAKIHIKGGTTFVEGVLYTGDIQTKKSWDSTGTLNEIMLGKYSKNPELFNFFGANIHSQAIIISGSINIVRYLKTTGFNILNGFVLPIGNTDALVDNFIHSDMYPFLKVAMGYYSISASARYISDGVHQNIVHSVTRFTDSNGYIKSKIDFKESSLYADYSDVVRFRISRGTTVILDSENIITFCFGGKDIPASSIQCECCGKLINVPNSGFVQCSDPHCPSLMFPYVNQFLHKMSLDYMSQDKFEEYVSSKKLLRISDVLELPEYSDITIHTTLCSLIRSLIPYKLISTDNVISIFANKCLNSRDTMTYYINNPDKIASDLNITDKDVNRLVCWLSDDYNAFELKTLMLSDRIIFDTVERSFDGPPIFRGKKIYVTGKFIHGSIIDICMILQSYAAEAVMTFSLDVDCILVGEMNEDTDGHSITLARSYNIPVFSEMEFFSEYEIDEDLAENGVVSE